MPVIACPLCRVSVDVPADGQTYSCPHCRSPITTAQSKPEPIPEGPGLDFEDDEADANRRPRRPPVQSGSAVGDFLAFRLMVTPIIIQILFWLYVLACVVFGARMIGESQNGPGRNDFLLAQGAAIMVVGPIFARVFCEVLLVIFQIHNELKDANDRQRYRR